MPDTKIPPPPEKPTPHQCCGSGCVPCIYDYYFEAFDKWNDKYGQAWENASSEESRLDSKNNSSGAKN